MADNRISLFPIVDLLKALGARPGNRKNTFHSPFREDKNASLHIDPRRNVWFDHGVGYGGGNIDLVMKCRNCSAKDAADYILSLPQLEDVPKITSGTGIEEDFTVATTGKIRPVTSDPLASRIIKVRKLHSPYLLEYFVSRGISETIAIQYCVEVILRSKSGSRSYDNIGFSNNNGGFALKSPSGFKSTTNAGITTIDMRGEFTEQAISGSVSVFEGFFDFLSWLSKERREVPSTDVVVLNSVSNVAKAIPYLRLHKTIICYLDNDVAGRATLETIKSLRRSLNNPTIIDGSLFYHEYKDLNDWWIAMLDRPK